jgi:hypothetical protein
VKRYLVLPLFLAACVADDRPRVVDYNGNSVTVEYAAPFGETNIRPTAAIVEVARETCPSAQHLSSRHNPENHWAALHLFRC